MNDLSHHLAADEKVLWRGAPASRLIFHSWDFLVIPFSLLWTGGVLIAAADVLSKNPVSTVEVLLISAMMAAGLFMVVGRFIVEAYILSGIEYAITDQRILIAYSKLVRRFTAVHLDRLADVELNLRGGGKGTIRFGPRANLWSNNASPFIPALSPQAQFIHIADAQSVFALIQNAMRRPASRAVRT